MECPIKNVEEKEVERVVEWMKDGKVLGPSSLSSEVSQDRYQETN